MLKLIIGLILLIALLISARYIFVENFQTQYYCDPYSINDLLSKVNGTDSYKQDLDNLKGCCQLLKQDNQETSGTTSVSFQDYDEYQDQDTLHLRKNVCRIFRH